MDLDDLRRIARELAEAGELPGMWEPSDLFGGWADTDSQPESTEPHPCHCLGCLHDVHCGRHACRKGCPK